MPADIISEEDRFGPDWEERTKTIRAWICHGTVDMQDLCAEMARWILYFECMYGPGR